MKHNEELQLCLGCSFAAVAVDTGSGDAVVSAAVGRFAVWVLGECLATGGPTSLDGVEGATAGERIAVVVRFVSLSKPHQTCCRPVRWPGSLPASVDGLASE